MLIEWPKAKDTHEIVYIGTRSVGVSFFPQPRYCGTRTREISDPLAVSDLRYKTYKEYIGPILEAIPELDNPKQQVDWLGGLRKLKEAVPPLVWEQFMAEEVIEVPESVDESDDSTGRVTSPPPLVAKRKPGPRKKAG